MNTCFWLGENGEEITAISHLLKKYLRLYPNSTEFNPRLTRHDMKRIVKYAERCGY